MIFIFDHLDLLRDMEDELKCSNCKNYFVNPVLLPCGHSLCLSCALALQGPSQASTIAPSGHDTGSDTASVCVSEHDAESDKVSVVSETDSGVICTSRPNSFIGTQYFRGILSPPPSVTTVSSPLCLLCPQCHKLCHFDESGANGLPRNKALANVVLRYSTGSFKSSSLSSLNSPTAAGYCTSANAALVMCQLCEGVPSSASVLCEQCEIFYCNQCQQNFHPARGPLAQHSLIPALKLSRKLWSGSIRECKCADHSHETLSMYCMVCKLPVCCMCLQDDRHINHDVQSLSTISKSQKVNERVVF